MAGFECEFVEKPSKGVQYECPICLLILREPYQATCCGKSFCKECIEKNNIRYHRKCPTCNAEIFSYPNKGLQQSLYDFKVYCSHKSKGCEWRGELRELDEHLNSDPPADKSLEGCPFTVVSCPLSHTGCEVKLPRRDVEIHVKSDFVGHLSKQMALVLALNAQLQSINEKLLSVEGEKKQLQQSVIDLNRKVEKLETALQAVSNNTEGHPINSVQITMANFKYHYDNDKNWNSPPFYTHPYGYKMCLGVWPRGFGDGSGTHLGVTVHVMCGEFDSQLTWPFRGDIVVQLVDQEDSRDHITSVFPFSDSIPNQYAKRVTKGELNTIGWGNRQFVPLSNLQPKYLQQNCIKLCVLKVILPQ